MANIWLITLILVSSFNGCTGKGECGHVPSTLVWPLGEQIVTMETVTMVTGDVTNIATAPGPPGLDYQALKFTDNKASVSLPVNIPGQLMLDYAFQFYLYTEAVGKVLQYTVDGPISTDDIVGVQMSYNSSGIFLTLKSPNIASTMKVDYVLNPKQWYRVSVGRDGSRDAVYFVLDGTEHEFFFPAWTLETPTLAPGRLVLGGGFTGRAACLQLIECRDPAGSVEYDSECVRAAWPSLPDTESTLTIPATTSTRTTTITPATTSTSSIPATTFTTTVPTTTTTPHSPATMPTTTTVVPVTTTTSMSPMATSSSTPPPVPGLRPAIPPVHITEQCVAR